jgi:hypothetical protein
VHSKIVSFTDTTKTLARVSIILFATGFISVILYGMIGQPSIKRLYAHNEIARFSPTFDRGMVQLLGEAVLLAIVAFVARKWLRIRL